MSDEAITEKSPDVLSDRVHTLCIIQFCIISRVFSDALFVIISWHPQIAEKE